MLNNSPSNFFSGVITLLISFTIHEYAHAWMATKLGDDTPRLYGRLTLNPLAHLDILGSLMLISVGFGWAKPVPVNTRKLKQHSSSALMLVALSGPVSNFLLAALAAIPLRFGWVVLTAAKINLFPTPYLFFEYFLYTNLGLMVFNLIPLPPLDGEEILEFLLPAEWQEKWNAVKPYGPYILIGLFILGPLIGFNLIGMLISPIILGLAGFLLGNIHGI
ncbi:MAG: site-2 protease family protein [Anaerolineaceae bacterium]|nr:site-2 protease family protein [Anaerolineaceae bacterium]